MSGLFCFGIKAILPIFANGSQRKAAVYGGGSVIDVPVSIAGDSFYYIPTHEMNAAIAVIAYRMKAGGKASRKTEAPSARLNEEEWKEVQESRWD